MYQKVPKSVKIQNSTCACVTDVARISDQEPDSSIRGPSRIDKDLRIKMFLHVLLIRPPNNCNRINIKVKTYLTLNKQTNLDVYFRYYG